MLSCLASVPGLPRLHAHVHEKFEYGFWIPIHMRTQAEEAWNQGCTMPMSAILTVQLLVYIYTHNLILRFPQATRVYLLHLSTMWTCTYMCITLHLFYIFLSFFRKRDQKRVWLKNTRIFQHLILMVKWLHVDIYNMFLIVWNDKVNVSFLPLLAGTDSRPASELLVEQRHMQLLECITNMKLQLQGQIDTLSSRKK